MGAARFNCIVSRKNGDAPDRTVPGNGIMKSARAKLLKADDEPNLAKSRTDADNSGLEKDLGIMARPGLVSSSIERGVMSRATLIGNVVVPIQAELCDDEKTPRLAQSMTTSSKLRRDVLFEEADEPSCMVSTTGRKDKNPKQAMPKMNNKELEHVTP